MTRNMGAIDRGLRFAIAAALILTAFTVPAVQGSMLAWLALGIAAIFTLTSVVSFCPLYTLIGLKTCKEC